MVDPDVDLVVVDGAEDRFEVDGYEGMAAGAQVPQPRGPESPVADEAVDQNDAGTSGAVRCEVIGLGAPAERLAPSEGAVQVQGFGDPGARKTGEGRARQAAVGSPDHCQAGELDGEYERTSAYDEGGACDRLQWRRRPAPSQPTGGAAELRDACSLQQTSESRRARHRPSIPRARAGVRLGRLGTG